MTRSDPTTRQTAEASVDPLTKIKIAPPEVKQEKRPGLSSCLCPSKEESSKSQCPSHRSVFASVKNTQQHALLYCAGVLCDARNLCLRFLPIFFYLATLDTHPTRDAAAREQTSGRLEFSLGSARRCDQSQCVALQYGNQVSRHGLCHCHGFSLGHYRRPLHSGQGDQTSPADCSGTFPRGSPCS